MVWTAPRTWTSGELLTAALLNTHLRDQLLMLSNGWDAYTPTWAATTNPAIGNGVMDGGFLQVGKWVRFSIRIVMGSTTTYGSGPWTLTLPVAPVASGFAFPTVMRDVSVPDSFPGAAENLSGSVLTLRRFPATAGAGFGPVNATAPFTWATSDVFTVVGEYEAA